MYVENRQASREDDYYHLPVYPGDLHLGSLNEIRYVEEAITFSNSFSGS